MSKVICHQSMSIDGFSAGPNQSQQNPIGEGGMRLHDWMFGTAAFRRMQGLEGGPEGADSEIVAELSANASVGAYVMGRNMFTAGRGEWDESWKGWWGEDPPYHAPTFVLTHYEREPLVMEGGTTFHFVTAGIEEALTLARKAAGNQDLKIGGGVSTVRQYLEAGLIDSLHLVSTPVLLGQGELLFDGLDLRALGFSITDRKSSEYATHLTLEKV